MHVACEDVATQTLQPSCCFDTLTAGLQLLMGLSHMAADGRSACCCALRVHDASAGCMAVVGTTHLAESSAEPREEVTSQVAVKAQAGERGVQGTCAFAARPVAVPAWQADI